jgi:hypothetical protein
MLRAHDEDERHLPKFAKFGGWHLFLLGKRPTPQSPRREPVG